MTQTFIIKDWAGNICFCGREFESFEDAWGFIYETDPQPEEGSADYDEHWYDDYFVEQLSEEVEP